MEAILKSFSIAVLLRSLFSGVFFVLSYYIAMHDVTIFKDGHFPDVSPDVLFVALFVGASGYAIHRALIFPFIEWFFNSETAKRIRTSWPLISDRTIEMLLSRWSYCRKSGEAPLASINYRIDAWADYTHFLYVATLCIAFGAIAARIVSQTTPQFSWMMFLFAVCIWLLGFFSHWRQMRLIDHATQQTPNQTPEPTRLLVTISACAELAPSSRVAHL